MTWPANGTENWNDAMKAHIELFTDSNGKIKDGVEFTTSAAPTVDAGVANKKYVDSQSEKSSQGDTVSTVDSLSSALAVNESYLTQTSGFVTMFIETSTTGNDTQAFVHTAPVATDGQKVGFHDPGLGDSSFLSFMVGQGRYFEVVGNASETVVITWTPMVKNGANPIKQ